MKHYNVNFIDGTEETVGSDELPPDIISPMFTYKSDGEGNRTVELLPTSVWWTVILLHLDAETNSKFVPFGRVHINLKNVTFIKET